jgi:hypothetical protein
MYNEPDTPTPMGSGLCKDGNNFSAAKAKQMAGDYCRQVKQFKGMGYQEIGSPAFSYTPTDQDFQNNCVLPFFEEVANDQECKEATNYFVWHMYTSCDSPAGVTKFCTDRTNDWADLMEKVEHQFGYSFKGMYITEFAGWWELCQDKGPQGTEGQAMVAEHCTPVLQQHPKVVRFSWFNDFGGPTQPGSSSLWNDDDTLSIIGQAYLKNASASNSDDSNSHATTKSSSSSTTTEAPSTENSDDSNSHATTRSSSSSTTTEAPSTQNSDDSSHENRSQDGQEVNSRNPSVEGMSCQWNTDCGPVATCCNQPGGGGTCWFESSCVAYCNTDWDCKNSSCKDGKCSDDSIFGRTGSDLDPRSSSSSTTTEAPSTANSDDSSYDATTRSSSSSTTDAPSSSTYGNHSTQSDYSSASDSTTQNLGFDFQTQNDGPRALII